jgi:hypothetical protein
MLFNQPGWRWCRKCQGLFFGPGPARVCPADGAAHDPTGSGPYTLPDLSMSQLNPSDPPLRSLGEEGWSHCSKCQGLFFSHAAERRCPGGGLHDGTGSGDYVIETPGARDQRYCVTDFQSAWKRCAFCSGIYFTGNVPADRPGNEAGACPSVPGGHIADETTNYLLMGAGPLDVSERAELLIVGPPALLPALQPLVAHKQTTGMPTLMVELDAVVERYEGRDEVEMLKRGITYAVECLGTRYVLLAGDASVMPVRYRWERFGSSPNQWRQGVYSPTDLYYANLYRDHVQDPAGDVTHGAWSDWDANGDSLYNFQDFDNDTHSVNPDQVDGYCDVAIGRLPTSDPAEVETYVNKVISYETGRLPAPHKSVSIMVDAFYDSWQSCENEIETRTPLTSANWPDVDRVGYNFTISNPPTNGLRDAGGEPIAEVVGASAWAIYVGHGSPGGWDIPGSDANSIAEMQGWGNTPPVLAAGCSTGQLTTFAPDGPTRYTDTAGDPHWYWTLPPGSGTPTEIVDYGANDPMDGAGVPVQTWTAAADGTLPAIMPAEPSVFQNDCLTVARQWLFSGTNTGAVIYFGEQTVAQNNWGTALAGELLHAAQHGSLDSQIVGDLWTAACRAYWAEYASTDDAIGNPRIYLSYMTLYGDPSLRTRPFTPA